MAMMPGGGQRGERTAMNRAEKHLPCDTQVVPHTSCRSRSLEH